MTQATLTIRGMTCAHCAQTVTTALAGVDRVTHAEVDLDTGTARVEVASDAALAAAKQAVVDTGYEVADGDQS